MASTPTPEDLLACRALLAAGSRSFSAAARLLPRRLRRPATALYAFCRIADDAVDLEADATAAVRQLHRRLDAMAAGRPEDHPCDRAFAAVMAAYRIPRELPAALIEGFAWDAAGRRYLTLWDLHAYAARVAGAVGAMMALLMDVRDNPRLARACDLGVAMQLTNICRDIGEDARRGRIYLPLDWLREEGVDPARWLAAPSYLPGVRRVVERLLAHADLLYDRAEAGIDALPSDCRAGIRAAARLYAEIGQVIRRPGFDPVARRAVVPAARKAALLAGAMLPRPARLEALEDPPLEATAWLVRAIPDRQPRPPRLEDRIAAVIEALARVEGRLA
ncbi:MAG: phytoene/squalene synthase family protein [Rhodovarius sp.]|nr:phytoene/squalene synthase family protein [Rhodovarius sp.]MCX7932203.1 phytoene/squalene synthase family protein [Rhodovarius sp.]MDW8313546.1 phytoene/squalene synthase family protein [Rhodovarius sp.]